MLGGDSLPAERYRAVFKEAMPSILPTVVAPMFENITDYSFFYGNSLVPQKLQNEPAYNQYTKNTTELAKYIGQSQAVKSITELFTGKKDGVSPIKIDHLIHNIN